ncbi:hypothetical protein [Arthrobacter sp. NPDC090010]|uniref:hypothetical protein n=1 Tax=Arthrobacter sp. NPDC090010 TaxID=3363942 RepID=UPI0037F7753A
MSTATREVVHHLFPNGEANDLVGWCGTVPGPDPVTGDWHTGHNRDLILRSVELGLPGCVACLSSEAPGGFTPLVFDDFDDETPYWGDDEPGW